MSDTHRDPETALLVTIVTMDSHLAGAAAGLDAAGLVQQGHASAGIGERLGRDRAGGAAADDDDVE